MRMHAYYGFRIIDELVQVRFIIILLYPRANNQLVRGLANIFSKFVSHVKFIGYTQKFSLCEWKFLLMGDKLASVSLKCFPPIHGRFIPFFKWDKIEWEDAVIGIREDKPQ